MNIYYYFNKYYLKIKYFMSNLRKNTIYKKINNPEFRSSNALNNILNKVINSDYQQKAFNQLQNLQLSLQKHAGLKELCMY